MANPSASRSLLRQLAFTRPTSRALQSQQQQQTPTAPRYVCARCARRRTMHHRAYVALGSNVGDRIANIEAACRALEKKGAKILRTSSLFQTKAMYVEDQADFLNGACEIQTEAEPLQLLDQLQSVEQELGRVKEVDKGPRNIDLDILLYDEERVEHERLKIPHPLMLEREFVLRPLSQLLPSDKLPPPFDLSTPSLSSKLSELRDPKHPIYAIVPLDPNMVLVPGKPTRKTQLMSILNLTPDSFSDGGHNLPSSAFASNYERQLAETILSHVEHGARIIDIGGQSTRPRAPQISAEEEFQRIKPALHAISAMPHHVRSAFAVSVDTYHADVAYAAVQAGADIINDVSAGQLDDNMLRTVAELGCTYVAMHMRGTPETMARAEHTDYSRSGGVVKGVATELARRVREAERAGVRRWRLVLDPGVGFAKNEVSNLTLLRNLALLQGRPDPRTGRPLNIDPVVLRQLDALPWLVGVSRKGFIGKITGVEEARQRVWGTAAAVAAAVQGGADVVRVHDVEEMSQVVKMAGAIWNVRE